MTQILDFWEPENVYMQLDGEEPEILYSQPRPAKHNHQAPWPPWPVVRLKQPKLLQVWQMKKIWHPWYEIWYSCAACAHFFCPFSFFWDSHLRSALIQELLKNENTNPNKTATNSNANSQAQSFQQPSASADVHSTANPRRRGCSLASARGFPRRLQQFSLTWQTLHDVALYCIAFYGIASDYRAILGMCKRTK